MIKDTFAPYIWPEQSSKDPKSALNQYCVYNVANTCMKRTNKKEVTSTSLSILTFPPAVRLRVSLNEAFVSNSQRTRFNTTQVILGGEQQQTDAADMNRINISKITSFKHLHSLRHSA